MFPAPPQIQWTHHNLEIKRKPEIHLVFTLNYYHLFPLAINLKLDYLWQIIQELVNVQQNSVHMLPQSGLFKQREGVGGILPSGGNGKYRCGIILSLVPNSNLKLKINIFILELSMLFSKEHDFILHTSNRILTFLRKTDISHIFHCFISLWISHWSYDASYMIHNSFFSKNRESYFHKPI